MAESSTVFIWAIANLERETDEGVTQNVTISGTTFVIKGGIIINVT